jgi:hypothetical protein
MLLPEPALTNLDERFTSLERLQRFWEVAKHDAKEVRVTCVSASDPQDGGWGTVSRHQVHEIDILRHNDGAL